MTSASDLRRELVVIYDEDYHFLLGTTWFLAVRSYQKIGNFVCHCSSRLW